MWHEFVRAADVDKLSEADLGNDSPELASRSRDTVACRTVTSRESLSRNHESCGIRAKVLEEVGEAVQEDKCVPA